MTKPKLTKKQTLIEQIVNWRQQMKGSVSEYNYRRLLNTRTTRELQHQWNQIQEGCGTLTDLGRATIKDKP